MRAASWHLKVSNESALVSLCQSGRWNIPLRDGTSVLECEALAQEVQTCNLISSGVNPAQPWMILYIMVSLADFLWSVGVSIVCPVHPHFPSRLRLLHGPGVHSRVSLSFPRYGSQATELYSTSDLVSVTCMYFVYWLNCTFNWSNNLWESIKKMIEYRINWCPIKCEIDY